MGSAPNLTVTTRKASKTCTIPWFFVVKSDIMELFWGNEPKSNMYDKIIFIETVTNNTAYYFVEQMTV